MPLKDQTNTVKRTGFLIFLAKMNNTEMIFARTF